MRSQLAAARFGLAALVLAALAAGGAIAAVRMGWMAYADGYRLMYAVVGLGFAALAAAILWLAKALKHNDGAGRKMGLPALFGSLLLLYPPLSAFLDSLSAPPIHDVSTDTANPPQFSALLKFRGPGANSPEFDGDATIPYRLQNPTANDSGMHPLSFVLHDRYYDLLKPRAGLVVNASDPVAVFFWRDFEAMKRTGWTIVDFNDKTRRIEATRASFWFGRISDIVVEARPSGRGARTVVRSQSRYDQVDNGFNADTVERYLATLRGG
jgi:hypothetical protein